MALLPKEPKQQKALIALVLLAGAVYAVREYLWLPKDIELTDRQAHVDSLTERNNRARITAARGTDLEARNAVYERHLLELEKLVPQNEEVPQLLNTINTQARAAGVKTADIAPEDDVTEQYYVRKSWTMSVYGEYDAIGRFLTSLASLPRIVTPKNVELARFTVPQGLLIEDENPVSARFRIELYVLPDATAQPVDSAAAPAVP
jgi:type IV pilus assembly protein PilO